MTHILLTGAGFSRNWGGWLADEVFEYLLGDPSITPSIRAQLWADKTTGGNYETTAQGLRDLAKTTGDDRDFKTFNSMLGGMFNAMKNAFGRQGFRFDFTDDKQISRFLYRFDWIFTLNQDTLLERHYFTNGFHLAAHPKWDGFDIPGLEHQASSQGSPLDTTSLVVAKSTGFALQLGRFQPYIKLHGSHNWMASRTSGLLLITGGNKETDINDSPLLAWYSQLFRDAICNQHARLMIIGYGFGDEHINRVLLQAAQAGAKFFVVNPSGVESFNKPGATSPATYALGHNLPNSVAGASRRPLASTFSSDSVEFTKLARFFE